MERLRQTHSKEIESKDDEVEEIRQSCSKKVNGVVAKLAMCANTACSQLVVFTSGDPLREDSAPCRLLHAAVFAASRPTCPFSSVLGTFAV